MIEIKSIDPTFEDNYFRIGSYLDMEIFRNKRIGTYNTESVLLRQEIPGVDTTDKDYMRIGGNLAPGLSTCIGCTAPIVFNLVAKAAQMRYLVLKKELLKRSILTEDELDRPEVKDILLKEVEPSKEDLEKAAINATLMAKIDEIKQDLIEKGLYFKQIYAGVTGCMTVTTASYPNNIWRFPYFHSAFENIGAVVSGLEAGVRARQKKGDLKIPHKVIGFAGDGGSFDIGLQSLSGLWERNPDSVVITYDNEAYMNTGKQRCSSTPWGADTSTTPVGSVKKGKQDNPKDIIAIAISHNIPYIATASPDDPIDLILKVRKALLIPGAAYLRILAPCPPGWGFDEKNSIKISKAAVDTAAFYSFEVETDIKKRRRYFTINNIPEIYFRRQTKREDIASYSSTQKRFRHMEVERDQEAIHTVQEKVDSAWKNVIEFFGLNGEKQL